MTALFHAVHNVRTDLEAVLAAADDAALKPTNRHVLNARQLLVGLRVLERECHSRPASRKAWSYGQAAVPVLSSTLNGLARRTDRGPRGDIDRCRRSLEAFSHALTAFAEGRE